MRWARSTCALLLAALAACSSPGRSSDSSAARKVAPVPAVSPSLRATPAAADPPTVIGPTHPKAVVDVARDLAGRMLVLDEETAERLPDSSIHGGFRSLDTFLDQLPAADRSRQRSLLVEDGFEGSVLRAYRDEAAIYVLDVTRFATAAGARRHLSGFTHGLTGTAASLSPVPAPVRGGAAYTGASSVTDYDELLSYQARGRYFWIVEVRTRDYEPAGVRTADAAVLAKAADAASA